MLAYIVRLISRDDPLEYIMSRPVLSERLAKWALLLSEFEIAFVPQKAVKRQALVDFLVDHPIPTKWELFEGFPDEEVFHLDITPAWKMFFDFKPAQKLEDGKALFFFRKIRLKRRENRSYKHG